MAEVSSRNLGHVLLNRPCITNKKNTVCLLKFKHFGKSILGKTVSILIILLYLTFGRRLQARLARQRLLTDAAAAGRSGRGRGGRGRSHRVSTPLLIFFRVAR